MGSSHGSKRPSLSLRSSRVRCLPALCIVVACVVLGIVIFQFGAFPASQSPLLIYSTSSKEDHVNDELMKVTIHQLEERIEDLEENLQDSVTFLPLIHMRNKSTESWSNAWFMSSFDKNFEDKNGFMYFPSNASKGRILCVMGMSQTDGTQNSYALAWRDLLPEESLLLPGLSFISGNHNTYKNIWHCLDSMGSFLLWSKRHKSAQPDRFVLYHKGRLAYEMTSCISMVLISVVGYEVPIERLDYGNRAVCFERSVVNRHGMNLFPLKARSETFDVIRQKARQFCNVPKIKKHQTFNFTLLTRAGNRSFKNETAISSVFESECIKVHGCRFRKIRTDGLSFCDQVFVMATTKVLATVHGTELTSIVFMEKGSHIMEMYPKGWLEFVWDERYLYRRLAEWAELKHDGSWHDTQGPECPDPNKGSAFCFSFLKDRQVGYNLTALSMSAAEVLRKVQPSKPGVQ